MELSAVAYLTITLTDVDNIDECSAGTDNCENNGSQMCPLFGGSTVLTQYGCPVRLKASCTRQL